MHNLVLEEGMPILTMTLGMFLGWGEKKNKKKTPSHMNYNKYYDPHIFTGHKGLHESNEHHKGYLADVEEKDSVNYRTFSPR